MKDTGLWEKIEQVDFDEVDAVFPFSRRLARDNKWNTQYARDVIQEYKRFAYLAITSEKPVTPSEEVDQAWHLHLVYTRHYWGEFCKALGKPLHHGPTKGGKAESEKYWEQYQYTLDRYKEEFGHAAASNIWPDVHERFSTRNQTLHISTKDYWVLRKPKVSRKWILGGGFSAFGLLTAGVAFAKSSESFISPFMSELLGFCLFVAVCVYIYSSVRSRNQLRKRNDTGCGTGSGGGSFGGGGDCGDGGGGCGGD